MSADKKSVLANLFSKWEYPKQYTTLSLFSQCVYRTRFWYNFHTIVVMDMFDDAFGSAPTNGSAHQADPAADFIQREQVRLVEKAMYNNVCPYRLT